MPVTSVDSDASKDLIKDKKTGEWREKLQEGGPGRKPKPREEKAGTVYDVMFDDEAPRTVVGVTNKGKPVHIKRDQRGSFFIEFEGGQLPRVLKGSWGRYMDARRKAHLYIEAYY